MALTVQQSVLPTMFSSLVFAASPIPAGGGSPWTSSPLQDAVAKIVQASSAKYNCSIAAAVYSESRGLKVAAAAGAVSFDQDAEATTTDDVRPARTLLLPRERDSPAPSCVRTASNRIQRIERKSSLTDQLDNRPEARVLNPAALPTRCCTLPLPDRPPNSPQIFIWGSITKVSTGASILKLAQEGKLRLNDTISQYVDPML